MGPVIPNRKDYKKLKYAHEKSGVLKIGVVTHKIFDLQVVAGHGQYNVHERALTQVVTAVLAESFGQSEIYSARPVTDSFEQTRMHTVPTI